MSDSFLSYLPLIILAAYIAFAAVLIFTDKGENDSESQNLSKRDK